MALRLPMVPWVGPPVPRKRPMFDELALLLQDAHLRELLAHYARLGAANREAWQDRRMRMDGVEPCDLATMPGALIAFDSIDQNTPNAPGPPDAHLPSRS